MYNCNYNLNFTPPSTQLHAPPHTQHTTGSPHITLRPPIHPHTNTTPYIIPALLYTPTPTHTYTHYPPTSPSTYTYIHTTTPPPNVVRGCFVQIKSSSVICLFCQQDESHHTQCFILFPLENVISYLHTSCTATKRKKSLQNEYAA